jgi:2-iminobutanoate/2-iminopropanoate deaminase
MPMEKRAVFGDTGPVQNAPYTPAVKIGEMLFVSGQVPIDPATSRLVEGGFEEQTRQVIRNLASLLKKGGSSLEHVVKTTVFLSDLNNFAEMNKIYGSYFTGVKPARSCVQVARLPLDSMIEIEAVALVPEGPFPSHEAES